MPADFIPRNDLEFSVWLTNFLNAAEGELTAIHLTTAELTALNILAQNFGGQLENFRSVQTSFHAATADKDDARKAAEDRVRLLVRRIQGYSDVTAAMKIALGINPRDSGRTHGEPTSPTQLMAEGFSNGVNELFWSRNGNKPNTIFVIEAMTGSEVEFSQVGTTNGTRFKHIGQTPGVHAVYRILAQRDGMTSLPSLSVSVYEPAGGTGSVTLKLAA